MKKVLIGILALIMLLGTMGCSRNEDITRIENLISDIGEVTIDSAEAIQSARAGYDTLAENQQDEIENFALLINAEETFIELAKNESKLRMLDRKPIEAIEILEKALPIDSSVQDDIDIIYSWCFECNGVLFIKPDLLYNDVQLLGTGQTDDDFYIYSLGSADSFIDYCEYAKTEFALYEQVEEYGNIISDYRFFNSTSGPAALELSVWPDYLANMLVLGVDISPKY